MLFQATERWVEIDRYSIQIGKEKPSEELGKDGQPFLRFRIEPAKPLELKRDIREEQYKSQVKKLIDEIQAQRIKDGKKPLDDAIIEERAAALAEARFGISKLDEANTAENAMPKVDLDALRKGTDESTNEWMKTKFGSAEDKD